LIIAATPPATGYELSMYGAYPDFLWVLISINIFFSIYTIIRSSDNQSNNLYYGYFSILLIETIIVFLPIIRGYYSMSRGAGDMYHHMFVASQILNFGYLPLTDYYPVMHIWLSIVYNFLPDFIILISIFSIVFFILYILSLYILGKTILGTKKGGIFVSIFGIPLIFSFLQWGFIPFFFALIIFPVILYAYQKITHNPTQKSRFYICLILLSLFIVFCHPLISVILIIMFSIFTFFELFKGWVTGRRSNIESANIVLIVSLTLVLWWLQFRSILNTLEKISSAFLGQGSYVSIIDHQMNVITTAKISIWLVIEIFIKTYGTICLYFSISLLFLLYIIYQYYQNKKIYEDDLIYSLQFFAALFIGFALLTGYFVIFEPIRAAMYGLILATILCGLFFYRLWGSVLSKKRQLGLCVLITLVMTLVCMLTMLALYSSPWLSVPNSALTYGEKNGMDWILEYRNAKIPVIRDEGSMYKYKNYYESMNARNSKNLIEYADIPANFGYMTNRTLGDSFTDLRDKKVYIITTEKMKLAPYAVSVDRRNRSKWFTDSDFIRLKNDPSVNLVYSSNELGVWNVAIP
jgi:hypothetical protein